MPESHTEGAAAKKPTIIPPTVGRVVLFHPGANTRINGVDLQEYSDQPMDAHVAYVWNDRLINIGGIDHSGQPFRATSVRLVQEGDEPQREGEMVCTWMDYQIGRAKKYEALAEARALAEKLALNTPAFETSSSA